MALPTDANVDMLICDAVRQTPEGKLDIAGYFPVPEVKVNTAVPLPVAINLVFVFVLKDGDGQFRAVFRLLDPLGKEMHRYDIPEFAKQPGYPYVIFLQVNQIPVAVAGNYAVVLQIEDREYRRPLRIFQ